MLTDRLMTYIAGAAALALGILALVLWLRLASVQSSLDTCGKQRAELSGKLELQTQATEDWQTAAEVNAEKAEAAGKRARQASESARARGEVLQAQILAGASTKCVDALAEIRKDWNP